VGGGAAERRRPVRRRRLHHYIFALLHLLNQVKTLGNVTSVIQRGLTAAESVFALIDEAPEVDTGTVAVDRARAASASST